MLKISPITPDHRPRAFQFTDYAFTLIAVATICIAGIAVTGGILANLLW